MNGTATATSAQVNGNANIVGPTTTTGLLTTAATSSSVPLIVSGGGLSSSVVGYWKFDEDTGATLNDSTSNGNNGTFNGTTGSQWVKGKINYGLSFNGTNNTVTLPAVPSLEFNTSFTVNFWMKSTYLSSCSAYPTFANTSIWPTSGWFIQSNCPYGTILSFTVLNGGTGTASSSFTPINDGNWHMVTAVYSQSISRSTATLYFDAASKASVAAPIMTPNTNPITIGSAIKGTLDEFGMWNVVLTPTQITTLYNSGSGRQYPFSGSGSQTADLADFLSTGGSVIANIDASGDIASTANLTATANVTGAALIPSGATAPLNGAYLPASNTLGFATNSTNAVIINASQQVGIGSSSPAAGMKADIAGPVKISGTGSESCTAAAVGAMRYNPTGQYFEICSP